VRLSSSKLPLLRECAWWARPEAVWDDRPGAEAIFGNAVHKVAELAISGPGRPPGAALGLVDVAAVAKEHELDAGAAAKLARVAVHLLAFLEANIRPGWVAEQPFAWNPRTGEGRALEKTPVHREYRGKAAGEIGTTLDVVGWLPDHETVVVLDFKSGSQVESPAGNWQLLTQAAAAVAAFGAARALIVVVYAYEEETLVQQATVDALDLEVFRLALVERLDQVPTALPQAGPWCGSYTSEGKYCPARASCPAVGHALALSSALNLPTQYRFGPPTSLEHAAWMLGALDLVGAGLKACEASLRAYADEHEGIPLPDGRLWRRHEGETISPDLSVPGALETLEQLGVAAAVKPSTSWSAIKEIGGTKAEGAAREALGRIRAVTSKPRVTYEAKGASKKGKAA